MRLTPLITLGLCVSPVWAQPNTATKTRPPAPVTAPLPAPPDRIEKSVRDFVSDVEGGQFIKVQDEIYGARRGYFGANEWSQKFVEVNPFRMKIQSVSISQTKGNEAIVTVKYHLELKDDKIDKGLLPKETQDVLAQERSETLSLKLVNSPYTLKQQIWQIVPPDEEPISAPEPGNSYPSLELAAYKMAQRPLPKSALEQESLRRLKAVGLASLQFAQDFDDQFAFSPEHLREALFPYLKDAKSWSVPGTLDTYTFNGSLSGRYTMGLYFGDADAEIVDRFPAPPEPFIKKPGKVVMFYEGHDQKPTFRYNGKAAICFADGHTALVTPEEARELIWNPE